MNTLRNIWLSEDEEHLLRSCVQDFHKASGNGGQKVNKTSSAVRLTHTPSGVTVSEAGNRSQAMNRINALKKLRIRIAMEIRNDVPQGAPGPDLARVPSLSNPAYAQFLALLLDHLAQDAWNAGATAERFGVSTSKLIKIIYRDSALWQELNKQRISSGLAPLKGIK